MLVQSGQTLVPSGFVLGCARWELVLAADYVQAFVKDGGVQVTRDSADPHQLGSVPVGSVPVQRKWDTAFRLTWLSEGR